MPDNTRPPRNLHSDEGPNLGTRALMTAIEELAQTSEPQGRVPAIAKRRREHVVALIFTGFERR
jgi:hypothetical protein